MGSRLLRWLVTTSILLFAALFLLLGVGLHLKLGEARELVANGARAEGVVAELVAAKGSTAYRYTYQYPAAGRTLTTSNRSIHVGLRDELRPGAKIPVWYDPAKPDRSMTPAELAELESWPTRIFFPVVAIALLAWGVMRLKPSARTPRGIR